MNPKNIQTAKKQSSKIKYKKTPIGKHKIAKWSTKDAHSLFQIEENAWAPWLRKPEKNFATIAKIFPDGQLKFINEEGKIIGFVTTNKINWDGKRTSLSNWETIAGGSIEFSDYSKTFLPEGNTLNLMSMSVDPDMQGKGIGTILFKEVIKIAKNMGVKHLICSFRPSKYGDFKLEPGNETITLKAYSKKIGRDGLSNDPWLRIANKHGMLPLRVERTAIKIKVPKSKFQEFQKSFNPNKWKKNIKGNWECGETGTWKIKNNWAIYTESNLWGEIPLK